MSRYNVAIGCLVLIVGKDHGSHHCIWNLLSEKPPLYEQKVYKHNGQGVEDMFYLVHSLTLTFIFLLDKSQRCNDHSR